MNFKFFNNDNQYGFYQLEPTQLLTLSRPLTFNNDVVKALPGPATDYSNFYVLTDDVINNGLNSRLHLINTSGTILSTWGDNNEIFHPKGMKIISNDNILISE